MTAARLPVALRFALRELRGGLRGFLVFLACIALGVGAIAGVNSVARSLTEGISAEGRTILGGDIAFQLVHREASADERAFLEQAAGEGRLGILAMMRAMARVPDGRDQALVELKAVDGDYPHVGAFALEGSGDLQAALALQDGRRGAVAVPELLDRLGLKVGDDLALGGTILEIRGIIDSEPDRLSDGIGFGPRLLVSLDALRESGLVRPGSLVTWHYRVVLPTGAGEAATTAIAEAAKARFPEAGWRIRERGNAAPALERNIGRFAQFLTLVGLTALVVGGVGVANAVGSFVDLKRPAIATLKCLGAGGNLVFAVYFLQILILSTLGIALGLAIGAVLPLLAGRFLADVLPVASAPALYPRELGLAALYGILVATGFSLWPLGRVRELSAANLFADRAAPARARPRLGFLLAQAGILAALTALAIGLAADRQVAVVFVGGIAAAFVVLRLVAAGIVWLARRAPHLSGTPLRLAVRNIQRPGALTASVVMSLGLGLTLLVTLALIDTNMRRQLMERVEGEAPDFFFLDVQDAEVQRFESFLAETAPNGAIERVPMLRGRIMALNGTPVAEIKPPEEGRWVLSGDRGLTYAVEVPPNAILTAGTWWPADHDGEPLVSFEAELAAALGLSIGDTVTVNVLGRDVTARIANLRRVEWESLSINFVMVFSPNTFRGAPHTHLATLRLAEGSGTEAERGVLRAVTGEFPGVTAVRVKDAVTAVNDLIGDLALGVRVAASLALVVSMLVLGGALAAGHRQRRQDAVILKALGATRARLIAAFSLEYSLLGLATALFAVAAGAGAAWYVIVQLMDFRFTFLPSVAAGAALVALAVTLGLGLVGTWRILSAKAAPHLRNL